VDERVEHGPVIDEELQQAVRVHRGLLEAKARRDPGVSGNPAARAC
jgi:hypothetical protein